MKKLFCMLLVLITVFTIAGCSNENRKDIIEESTTEKCGAEENVTDANSVEKGSYILYVRDEILYQLDCKTGASIPVHTDDQVRSVARHASSKSYFSYTSEDGQVVYFISDMDSASLYVVDHGADANLIAKGVCEYCISDDGQYAIYVTMDASLFYYDLKRGSTTLLADGCGTFSSDRWLVTTNKYWFSCLYRLGDYVYYQNSDLYRIAFGGEPECIAENVRMFDRNYIANNDLLYYVEEQEGVAYAPVYQWRNGKKACCVDSAREILQVYPDGSFFYIDGSILTKYEQEVLGYTSDKLPTLCYYDGSKSAELFTFNGSYRVCFHPELPGGVLEVYGEELNSVDIYTIYRDEYTVQKETAISDFGVYEDAVWYGTDSGLYKLSVGNGELEASELVVSGSAYLYHDTVGNLVAYTQSGIFVNGTLLGDYDPEHCIYYRMDELVTMESDHQWVDFEYPNEPDKITYPFTNDGFAYTLFAWINGETVEVAGNVIVHYGFADGTIVYISNMDETTCTGKLYLYRNGESKLVGEDVYGIVPCV